MTPNLVRTTALPLSATPPPAPAPTASWRGPRPATSVVRVIDRRAAQAAAEDTSAEPEPLARMEHQINQVAAEVHALRETVADHGEALARVEDGLREVLAALGNLARVPADADAPTDAQ